MSLTRDQLAHALTYNPETGDFIWRHRDEMPSKINARFAGKVAGSVIRGKSCGPYRRIWLHGRHYLVHRLAWLYMTGEWPSAEIDHIDRDGLSNKWSNLREASRSDNNANKAAFATNQCGVKGASFVKGLNKYRAEIQRGPIRKHLGYFDTAEEANAAYLREAKLIHGEYARAS